LGRFERQFLPYILSGKKLFQIFRNLLQPLNFFAVYLGIQTQINAAMKPHKPIKQRTGPGQSHREGISWIKLMQMFPDNETAEKWFAEQR